MHRGIGCSVALDPRSTSFSLHQSPSTKRACPWSTVSCCRCSKSFLRTLVAMNLRYLPEECPQEAFGWLLGIAGLIVVRDNNVASGPLRRGPSPILHSSDRKFEHIATTLPPCCSVHGYKTWRSCNGEHPSAPLPRPPPPPLTLYSSSQLAGHARLPHSSRSRVICPWCSGLPFKADC
jgi:hypothetical protein